MSDKVDLVINGGTIVSPDASYRASIAIKDGVIHAIGAPEAMPPATQILDATGLHVLPGAIDVHVHFRDPGYPQKEDFASGTAAAAFGGVTTVFDMPNTLPTINNAEALADKHKIASAKAYVDYGLYAVLGEDSIEHVDALIDGGVIGFKLYMGNTFGRIPSPTTGAMLEAFEVVAPTGKRISLHAETNSIMERREARLRASGRIETDRASGSTARRRRRRGRRSRGDPRRMDRCAHPRAAHFLRCRIAAAGRSQGAGRRHYRRDLPAISAAVGDRLREIRRRRARQSAGARKPNQQPLWNALMDGTIDMIATDHAPHAPDEKTRPDIWTVDCGFPGVETQMPLMLTEINKGRATINDYVRWSAESPAKIWGLYPRKGTLTVGSDADIAIVDLKREWTVDDAMIQSRAKISPWHGRKASALPIHTIVRGRFVMKDRILQEEARGTGQSVHAIQQMPPAMPANTDSTMAAITSVQKA